MKITMMYWVDKVRNSKISSVFSVIIICLLSLIIPAKISEYSNLAAQLALGICVFVGGCFLFGTANMGATLKKSSFQNKITIILFLVTTLLLNFTAAPIKSVILEKVDIAQILVTGFWEEVLFRGFMFALWAKIFTNRSPVLLVLLLLVTSSLFGYAHINQNFDFLIRSSLGFLLGVVFLHTQTIWFSVFLHAFHNGLTMMITYGDTPSVALQVMLLLFSCLLGLAILLFSRRNQTLYTSFPHA